MVVPVAWTPELPLKFSTSKSPGFSTPAPSKPCGTKATPYGLPSPFGGTVEKVCCMEPGKLGRIGSERADVRPVDGRLRSSSVSRSRTVEWTLRGVERGTTNDHSFRREKSMMHLSKLKERAYRIVIEYSVSQPTLHHIFLAGTHRVSKN